MSTLDQPNTFDESAVSPWPVIQRWALIGGLVFIIYFMVATFTGLSDPGAGALMGILSLVISIALYFGLAALATRQHRDEDLKGFISFKRAFRVGFLSLFLAALISAAFSLIYVTLIDPAYYDNMLDALVKQWETQGLNEEQIDNALAFTEPMMSPWFTLGAGVIGGAIFSALIALISSSIFKRVPPEN